MKWGWLFSIAFGILFMIGGGLLMDHNLANTGGACMMVGIFLFVGGGVAVLFRG